MAAGSSVSSQPAPTELGVGELAGMLATLESYACMFGPYHIQTLSLGAQVAPVLRLAGETVCARVLLERAAVQLTRYGDPASAVRMQAIAALRDLLTELGEFDQAILWQKEMMACRLQLRGADDPGTVLEREILARMLMSAAVSSSTGGRAV
jgi:hypothetical protein